MSLHFRRLACLLVVGMLAPVFGLAANANVSAVRVSQTVVDDKEDAKAVRKAYLEIKKLIAASKWKEASSLMTTEGQDLICTSIILASKGIVVTDLPMEIPAFSDAIDEIEDSFVKHGLDKLDLDVQGRIRISMGGGNQSSSSSKTDDSTSVSEKKVDNQKKILKFLTKSDKRWSVISDVFKALQTSPLGMNELVGRVQNVEINGDTALVEIEMEAPPKPDGGGISISINSPPVFVRMKKTKNGKWMYNGRDFGACSKAGS